MAIPLNFKIQGRGDPIIILHGFLGSLDNWQSFAKQLAKDNMVITVDQRNHGKSPHTTEFSFDLMSEDLHQLMENEWIHSAVLMGHSMGGKTAMQFALSYPDMVEKLIILDIAPRKYKSGHREILNALNQISIDHLNSRIDAESILSNQIAEKGIRQFLLKNLKRKNTGFSWKMNLAVLTEKYDSIIKPIESEYQYLGPTLFIRGSKSEYIQENDRLDILQKFPSASISTIEGAGHWIHVDQPEELKNEVLDFIKS